MKFPNRNTYDTFVDEQVSGLHVAGGNPSDSWLMTLQEICLKTIANNWETNPEQFAFENNVCYRQSVLDRLTTNNTDIYKLSKYISDDNFWKRLYHEDFGPRYEKPQKWITAYMEKRLKDMLEKLKPADYNEESVIREMTLYCPHVNTLTIHNLQAPVKSSFNHIPLNLILGNLTELQEIDFSVNVKDPVDDFVVSYSNLSDQDVVHLAAGLGMCDDLKRFRLAGTKLTPTMAAVLGRAIERCTKLEELTIENCNLNDNGVKYFLFGLATDSLPSIKDINLANNFISSEGTLNLAEAFAKRNLVKLNIRLNPIKSDGACLLLGVFYRSDSITSINMSACSLDSNVEALLLKVIEQNNSLLHLNLAINSFSESLGWTIVSKVQDNKTLMDLDIRNAGVSSIATAMIESLTTRNCLDKES